MKTLQYIVQTTQLRTEIAPEVALSLTVVIESDMVSQRTGVVRR
jgi:hypothetical protein